ncbi:MAG TPA: ATP-binding protein [Tepidisphaeraceae bacterium]|jgi:PAS domain S-box-containing protein
MNRISARWRIAFGLVALLSSVLMLAIGIGLVPSQRELIMESRARLCEAVAVGSSVLATRGDIPGLQAALGGVAGRNKDILSAAVRDQAGKLVAVVGEHERNWANKSRAEAVDSYVYVPILANDVRWGTVEIRFKPIAGATGIWAYVFHPSVRLVLFVSGGCFLLFIMYLRKMLQHLDPSKVVPSRVRNALDTLTEGLIVLDNQERIVLANHEFARLVGKSPEALIGARIATMPWVVQTEAGEMPWVLALSRRTTQKNRMLRLKDSGGVVRTFAVNCSPVTGQDGKYRGVLVSFDDVTQLEAQKIELNKSKEAAESANRAKSEFLARMSHEIRTPMNAILGFADVLRRGYETSEAERKEYLETIHASGQHLLELINDILDLSKIESGRMQIERTRFSPHELVAEVATVLRVKAKQKNIRLDYQWSGPIPESIESDPTRLRQVVTNIVGNAIKFTEKGSVRIVARMANLDDPTFAIDVIDTGIGISAESVDQLFQPFSQADTSITRRFGGTGLGLTISRQLAEAMGGTISVASQYGEGSTFTITLKAGSLSNVKLLETMPMDDHATETETTSLKLPPLKVLSVDDGESNQKLIAVVLSRAGVAKVDQARNGRDGLQMALTGDYDVVLMDMQMPIMDGYTAVAELRQRGKTIPVVALTAHAMKGESDKCLAAGCTAFVPKPIEVDLLLKTIADVTGSKAIPTMISTRAAEPPTERTYSVPATALCGNSGIRSTLPVEDPDFREVVVEFVDRLHEQLGEMEKAWEEREIDRLATLAHWLKGSGGTAGFPAFTAPAKQLETVAKEMNLREIEKTIGEIKQLAAQVVAPSNSADETSTAMNAQRASAK